MADYWKSNDRKYCDFCKCWITDNAPSISFHENGKRHKANVAKRITEISKKSLRDEKAQQKVDQQIRQMEDAAMRAYNSDIGRGGDITSRALIDLAATAISSTEDDENVIKTNGLIPGPAALPARAIDPLLPPIDIMEEEERNKKEAMKKKQQKSGWQVNESAVGDPSLWCEARSDEGYTYYWNVKTGETCWEAPKEGYMTLAEYNRINKISEAQKEIELHKESMYMRKNADEIVAKYRREELKKLRPVITPEQSKQNEEEERENYQAYEEPGWSAKPLGQWTPVEPKKEQYVDLQLPKVEKHIYQAKVIGEQHKEPPIKQFKEKTITSLDDSSIAGTSNTFKKRKITGNRNARQRLDDD